MDSGFAAYSEGIYIPEVESKWSTSDDPRPKFQ